MNEITIYSFAKINLGLNVVSKRVDGYHNIETIFYPLQLKDKLFLKKSDVFSFQSNNTVLISEANNLVIKAKILLEEYFKKNFSVEIFLKKNIPIGAGLGGGSSNGASTLLALNELFHLDLSKAELYDSAICLGSDVPFFLNPSPKFAEKKGEYLEDINLKINKPILIVNPGIHVSTAWAYSNIIPKKSKTNLKDIFRNEISDFSELRGIVTNDFEDVVFKQFPEIEDLKSYIYKSGAEFALMSGSGSTIFGIYPDLELAQTAEKVFSEKYFTFIHFEEN